MPNLNSISLMEIQGAVDEYLENRDYSLSNYIVDTFNWDITPIDTMNLREQIRPIKAMDLDLLTTPIH